MTKLRDISSHQVVGGGLSSGALKNLLHRATFIYDRLISRVIARNLPPLIFIRKNPRLEDPTSKKHFFA